MLLIVVVKEEYRFAYNFKKEIHATISKDEYLQTIAQLQKHILRGDCYEINFCQEFFIDDARNRSI